MVEFEIVALVVGSFIPTWTAIAKMWETLGRVDERTKVLIESLNLVDKCRFQK